MTASSAECPNPRYEFWVQYPNKTWYLKQGWGGASFNWNTSGLVPGAYIVHAWVNNQGSGYDTIGSATVTLTTCNSAAIDPANPSQPAGSVVALTASSAGCLNPRYEFWVQYPNKTWYLKQGWGGASFNWNTSGLVPGVYIVHAWVNRMGTGWDVIGSATVTLTGCSSASLIPVSGSTAQGSAITFTASSTGCPNPVYAFWLQDPTGVWHLMQTFGPANTWTWNTAGWAKGMYTIHVWANQEGAYLNVYDEIGSATRSVT
jgi:hypothetical protein